MAITRVLITVTTYPLPSNKYQELVCTAGLLENGQWIRIYPIPLSKLISKRFNKYQWVELDLELRPTNKDFRPATYSPVNKDMSDLKVVGSIPTTNEWELRKMICLQNVYHSMDQLIADAYDPSKQTSLATYKPFEILEFIIEEDERDWKPQWKAQMEQLCMFTGDQGFAQLGIKKVPYKFKYRFKDEKGKTRSIMVEDWEIGQLYWNCYRGANGDEERALEKIYQKCWGHLAKKCDLHFFMGTTLEWHQRKAKNPFVIVGLFYPPKVIQTKLEF